MKILLVLSVILNFLIAWWGYSQVEIGKETVSLWETRDHRRRDSIQILSQFIVNRTKKFEVIQVLKEKRPDFFEKEEKLEAGDLSFTYEGDNIIQIEPLIYGDKSL